MPIDRREQVFVSSTYLDLQEERRAIIQTLLEADCLPAGMELFPASDDERWDLIKRVIDDSDYYVLVIGGRYGSVDEDGLSFTEKEFDYAVETGKPVMAFLHGAPGKIAGEKIDMDPIAREKLDAFREKASKRMVKHWTNPDDLAGAVALSLIQTRKTHPAVGWIRATHALTPEVEREIAELRERVATLQAELNDAKADAPVVPIEDLASGDEIYQMDANVRYWSKAVWDAGRRWDSTLRSHGIKVELSWNDIFSAVGPLLMDEASEQTLDEELDRLAYIHAPEPIPTNADDDVVNAVLAASEVVHEVKVQLFSLGLIKKSDRRHPINDDNTYWTLTDAGRDQLMRLRAIRKSPAPEA